MKRNADLLQLRDSDLKQIVDAFAQERRKKPTTVHRELLEIAIELYPILDPATVADADAHLRARRVRVLIAPLLDYLAQYGELPWFTHSTPTQTAPVPSMPSATPEPRVDQDDFELGGDISGFSGGID